MSEAATETITNDTSTLVAVAVFTLVVTSSIFVSYFYLPNLIDPIQVVASVTLTAVLVILYYQQYTIMENQADLMREEHTPHLERDGLFYKESEGVRGDDLLFRISNTGKGTATNLRVHAEFEVNTDLDVEFPDRSFPLTREWGSKERPDVLNKAQAVDELSNYMRPEQSMAIFSCEAAISYRIPDKREGFCDYKHLLTEIAKGIDPDVAVKDSSDEESTDNSKYYKVTFPDRSGSTLSPERYPVNEFEFEVNQERSDGFLSFREPREDDIVREKAFDLVDFNKIHATYTLYYEDLDGAEYSLKLLDRMIPLHPGTSSELLFISGVDYDGYYSGGIPTNLRLRLLQRYKDRNSNEG